MAGRLIYSRWRCRGALRQPDVAGSSGSAVSAEHVAHERPRVNPLVADPRRGSTQSLGDWAIASSEHWPEPRPVLLQRNNHPITTALPSAWPRTGSSALQPADESLATFRSPSSQRWRLSWTLGSSSSRSHYAASAVSGLQSAGERAGRACGGRPSSCSRDCFTERSSNGERGVVARRTVIASVGGGSRNRGRHRMAMTGRTIAPREIVRAFRHRGIVRMVTNGDLALGVRGWDE